jgi:hypothetical protein
MKVKFGTFITNIITGERMKMNDKDLTLGAAVLEALLVLDPQKPESGESKAKSYALAARIVNGMKVGEGEVEVSVEEAALIKQKVGDLFSPAVVGPAYEMLEGRVIGEA